MNQLQKQRHSCFLSSIDLIPAAEEHQPNIPQERSLMVHKVLHLFIRLCIYCPRVDCSRNYFTSATIVIETSGESWEIRLGSDPSSAVYLRDL